MRTTIGDSHAFERPVKPDVNIDLAVILVEVKERPGAAREVAALALSQLRKTAQLHKQRLYAIKVFVICMAHVRYRLSYRHFVDGERARSAFVVARSIGQRRSCPAVSLRLPRARRGPQ